MTDNGDVIDLAKVRAKRMALGVKARDYTVRACKHDHVLVAEHEYLVECADCGAPLDPHRVLLGYAHEERHFQWLTAKAKRELKKLHASIAELKREERNAKARVRRAKARTPTPPAANKAE